MSCRVSSQRVFVGLSGGVDSSVAALLLQRQGYEVDALFMKNWEEDDEEGYCAAAEDLADAEAVCRELNIALHKVNFSSEYWDRVFAHFLRELGVGRTPNPDILCNREIKFGAFLEHALSLGAERIATGHYARIATGDDGHHRLLKGRDAAKDQSYFLYTLGQAQLTRVMFPLGDLTKTQVRRIAAETGLRTHAKSDSTGICFIGERPFNAFLERYLRAQPGEIRSPDGVRLGCHRGLSFYTLGQRKGLGIGGQRNAAGDPWFVIDKDLESNTLIVAQGHDHALLHSRSLVATDLNWVAGHPPETPTRCHCRTRYRQPDQPCEINRIAGGQCHVAFSAPQRAVTPGQSVVFYRGEECLGGGVIQHTRREGS